MAKHKQSVVVTIREPVLQAISTEAGEWTPTETGGILLGNWTSWFDVHVTAIVGPGPKAIHTHHFFLPDDDYHIIEIAKRYRNSKGKETYLGDWHSHPCNSAYLSETDKRTLRKIAAYKPARLHTPLMLVYGTEPVEVKVWYHVFKGLLRRSQIMQCELLLVP